MPIRSPSYLHCYQYFFSFLSFFFLPFPFFLFPLFLSSFSYPLLIRSPSISFSFFPFLLFSFFSFSTLARAPMASLHISSFVLLCFFVLLCPSLSSLYFFSFFLFPFSSFSFFFPPSLFIPFFIEQFDKHFL